MSSMQVYSFMVGYVSTARFLVSQLFSKVWHFGAVAGKYLGITKAVVKLSTSPLGTGRKNKYRQSTWGEEDLLNKRLFLLDKDCKRNRYRCTCRLASGTNPPTRIPGPALKQGSFLSPPPSAPFGISCRFRSFYRLFITTCDSRYRSRFLSFPLRFRNWKVANFLLCRSFIKVLASRLYGYMQVPILLHLFPPKVCTIFFSYVGLRIIFLVAMW